LATAAEACQEESTQVQIHSTDLIHDVFISGATKSLQLVWKRICHPLAQYVCLPERSLGLQGKLSKEKSKEAQGEV
jgi:hypothetical protein